jgi:hypothetical protein
MANSNVSIGQVAQYRQGNKTLTDIKRPDWERNEWVLSLQKRVALLSLGRRWTTRYERSHPEARLAN